MQIEYLRLDDLIPYENNPRDNTQAIEKVQASIDAFDFRNPIQVDKNKVIICGHTRFYAAKRLGLEVVPVIIQADMTEEEADAYRLADNKTQEFALWDDDKLNEELDKIKNINLSDFGFEKIDAWFNRTEKEGKDREEGNEEYNEFLEKFEAKKTTDDCYTPDNIYEVVADYVENRFGVNRKNFMRPFYPGGDYQAEKYQKNTIVVDNPPFSILAKIVDYYVDNGVKFFLFAPGTSTIGYTTRNGVQAICTHAGVTYENGAKVVTNFLTNLNNDSVIAISDPELYKNLDKANEETLSKMRKNLPKYEYPVNVVTAAKLGYLSKHGQKIEIKKQSAHFIRKLDAQGDGRIYGSGLLISEKAAAEKAAAHVFKLSDRELEIIAGLE